MSGGGGSSGGANSVEHFVSTVRSMTNNNNFSDLAEFCGKSFDMLARNHSNLMNVAATLETGTHSLGMSAVLSAALNQGSDIPDWDDLFGGVVIFIKDYDEEQMKHGPLLFADLCHRLTDELV